MIWRSSAGRKGYSGSALRPPLLTARAAELERYAATQNPEMPDANSPLEPTMRHAVDSGGSFSYENWRAALRGARRNDAYEYPLFSDTRIVGEATFGPYLILNAIADIEHAPSQAVLVLRAETHVTWSFADMSSTDTSRYHGGTECDEIAALISLALGCRLKAGDSTRWFKKGDDPRGRPWSFRLSGRADPVPPHVSHRGALVSRARVDQDIARARALLDKYVAIEPSASIALVRAARLYQEALWISEADAALAWLLLVSAVEVAANHWRSAALTPREKLTGSKPELERLLIARGGEELADQVAVLIHETLGATSKFVNFCMKHLPAAPEVRPEASEARVRWDSRRLMKEALSQVYNYRSRALHDGTPFPAPMCSPPYPLNDGAERPAFGAMGSHGGIWRNEDIPMFLHVFEHIVRGALCAWWSEMPRP
jgi:hypothetical protein